MSKDKLPPTPPPLEHDLNRFRTLLEDLEQKVEELTAAMREGGGSDAEQRT